MASFITAGNATNGLQVSSDNTGILQLKTGTGSGTTAVTFDTGQRATFPSTISVGNTTPATTGAGITFPATQSASSDANTLDDYEEGNWTPVLGGSSGNPTVTYATQEGVYTKVGNLVTVSGRIILTARSGGSGTAELRGLPFTVGATNNIFVGAVTLSAVDFGVNTKYVVSRALSGSTYLILEECNDNAVSNTMQVSAIGATADIIVNFSYRV